MYINDNSAPLNTIAGYERHADRSLTALPGCPFSTGGAGTGHGIGSQGALQIAGHGRYLVAVDAGSNQVSVLRIYRDGGLRVVPGGVVSSGGADPVSVAVHRHVVSVANAGAGTRNDTNFRLTGEGRLHPIAGSTGPLADGSVPGDVLFNSTGTNLVGLGDT